MTRYTPSGVCPGLMVDAEDGEWVKFEAAAEAIREARAKRDSAYVEAALARAERGAMRAALDAACLAGGLDPDEFIPSW